MSDLKWKVRAFRLQAEALVEDPDMLDQWGGPEDALAAYNRVAREILDEILESYEMGVREEVKAANKPIMELKLLLLCRARRYWEGEGNANGMAFYAGAIEEHLRRTGVI